MLVKKYPDIKLYVGGDCELKTMNDAIQNKKINENVKYLGWIDKEKKDKVLRESSIFVLPSYNEGMPMSILEAMAYKNVTIATNVWGILQIIKNKENGIIINPRDKEALYNNIEMILEDKKLGSNLSIKGRKTIEEKFNMNKNIRELVGIYKNELN